MQTKKSEPTKAITSALMSGLLIMSTIAVAASIIMTTQSASAQQNTVGKDQDCLPRSTFNGKENAGNEHFSANGDFDQSGNPHDTAQGFPRGNPHDRCHGS